MIVSAGGRSACHDGAAVTILRRDLRRHAATSPVNALRVADPPRSAAELREQLDVLELVPYDDPDAAAEPALLIGDVAARLGCEDLVQRARLVHADVIGRGGDTAGAGLIVRQVSAWAVAHANTHVQARAERLLSAFFSRVGDMTASLEHAVHANELLGPDALPRLRADHLMALALALARTGSFDAARDRFRAVLRIADATDDVPLRIAVLNNMAFIEYWAGDPQAAMTAARRMQDAATRNGIALDASYLDTIARAQMMLGQYAAAERTLVGLLPGGSGHAPRIVESDGLAEVLLTLAECQRMIGDTERAQSSLDQAVALCEERDLQEVLARIMQEQAAVFAAQGRFPEAYDLHVQFHEASEALNSSERDARARTLQAVFETEEAQRSSRQFREMSLRDPLTGLYNRRYVDDRLPALLSRARDQVVPLSLALIDVDHFKQVNDRLSHDVGDAVLLRLGELLQVCADEGGGFVARLGGEEFLLVLPGHDVAAATAVCEALRMTVSGQPWGALLGDLPLTVSLGVAGCFAGAASAGQLLALADERLYASKHAGRDRVTGD